MLQTNNNAYNIMIIESVEPLRKGMEVMLDELNMVNQKLCTYTAKEAVKLAPYFKTQVAFVSYIVPDMPAAECIKQLKKVTPAAAIVAVIPDLKPAQINELIKCGCLAFLPVSFTTQQLNKAFFNAVNGNQYFTEDVANKMIAHAQKKIVKTNSAPDLQYYQSRKKNYHCCL